MRVISGTYGGRTLKAVPGKHTRPTSDKVKESMFQIIGPYFSGGRVLDLYSGSGALGIEAVSRGMEKAILVDDDSKAIKTIKENVNMTKEAEKFTILKNKASQMLEKFSKENKQFDLVLLDPPYANQEIAHTMEELIKYNLLSRSASIVCETDDKTILPNRVKDCVFWREKVYGSTKITFYEMEEE